MKLMDLIRGRAKAHDDRVKEKRGEYIAEEGARGTVLEDLGEHEDTALPDRGAGGSWWSGWAGPFGRR